MRRVLVSIAVFASLSLGAASAEAVSLVPLGGAQNPLAFEEPIHVTSAPNNADRLFVVEKGGTVEEVLDGEVRLFADLDDPDDLVFSSGNEQGLLSIALAPDFAVTKRFYAAYTGTTAAGANAGDVHIDAFVADDDGAVTRVPMLTIPHPTNTNHNGGQLQFGPDGYLYGSVGDGGGGGDGPGNAQNLEVLLGKILRIDPKPDATGGAPTYSVPADNPFVGIDGRDEIWAYGLRNPWRFSFDRLSGDLVIGDVGQEHHEEIDLAPAPLRGRGINFGWNCREGLVPYVPPGEACDDLTYPQDFVDPIFEYEHTRESAELPSRCSITGGYVARDPGIGELYGRYLYADFCGGQIHSLDPGAVIPVQTDRNEGLNPLPNQASNPVSFGEDACGRLYVVSSNARVLQLIGDQGPGCVVSPPPVPPVEEGGKPRPPIAESALVPTVRLTRKNTGKRAWFLATVSPCTGGDGLVVQLRRGGKQLRTKPLPANCRVKFELQARVNSSFRAVLVGDPAGPLRSEPLRFKAAKAG